MATKQSASQKQPSLASLKKALAEEKAHNEKLQKDLKQMQDNRDYYVKAKDEADKEVESIHTLLDVLPGALARKTVPNPEQEWNTVTHTLMTRFAAYLAFKKD